MMSEPVSQDLALMAVAANLLPDTSGLAPLSLPEDILRDAPRPRTPPSPEAVRRFEAAMAGLPEGTGQERLRAAVSLFQSVAMRDLPADGSPTPATPQQAPAADAPQALPVPADMPAAAEPVVPSGTPAIPSVEPPQASPLPQEEPVPPAATATPVARPGESTPGGLATDGRMTAIEQPVKPPRQPDAPAVASVATPSAPAVPQAGTPPTRATSRMAGTSAPAVPQAGTPLRGMESAALRPEMPSRKAKIPASPAPGTAEKPETVLQAAPVAVDAPAAPASPAPAASEAVAAAASARTEAVAETVERIATAVASQITFTPALARGEGEVKITLAPTVLDGSGIALSASDGTLSVTITPATAEAAQTAAVALPQLEAALAAHAPAFHRVAVTLAAKRGVSDETV
jgi:hypothetical protein